MWNWIRLATTFGSWARLQWAPSLTSHDPNPPINLESPDTGGLLTPNSVGVTTGANALAQTTVAPAAVGVEAGCQAFPNNAFRITGQEDAVQLATRTNPTNAFMLGWVKLSADRNAYSCVFSFENGGSFVELITDADGVTLCVFDAFGLQGTLGVLTVGVAYKVGLWVGTTTFKAWLGTEGTPGVTETTGTCTPAGTLAYQGIGTTAGDPAGEWWNGLFSRVRAGNGAITEAEVEAEFTSETPLHAGIIGSWFPRNMTAAGALTAQTGADLVDGAGAGSPAYTVEAAPTLDPFSGGGSLNVTPAVMGVVTGSQAPVLLVVVTPGTAGVATGTQAPTLSTSVAVASTGVVVGTQAPNLTSTVSPTSTGVACGTQAPAILARVLPTSMGVVTGTQALQLLALASVGTAGVSTGTQAPTIGATSFVTPAALGVLVGTQLPTAGSSVLVGTTGVATGSQAPSLSASISIGTTGATVGTQAPLLRASISVSSAGVLVGTQAPVTPTSVAVGTSGVLVDTQVPVIGVVVSSRSTLLDGSLAFWKLDGTAEDAQGTNDGTLVGSGSWGTGKLSQGYVSAASSRITVPGVPGLKPRTAITVAGWFNFSALQGANLRAVSDWHQDGGYDRWILGYSPDGTNVFSHMFGANRSLGALGSTIPLNTWTHLAITWQQDGGGPMTAYRNGAVVDSLSGYTGTLNPAWPDGSLFPVCIGGQHNSGPSMVGSIDEIGIWDRALSAAEIAELVSGGAGITHPFTPAAPGVLVGTRALSTLNAVLPTSTGVASSTWAPLLRSSIAVGATGVLVGTWPAQVPITVVSPTSLGVDLGAWAPSSSSALLLEPVGCIVDAWTLGQPLRFRGAFGSGLRAARRTVSRV